MGNKKKDGNERRHSAKEEKACEKVKTIKNREDCKTQWRQMKRVNQNHRERAREVDGT